MNAMMRRLGMVGLRPDTFLQTIRAIPWYLRDLATLRRQLRGTTDFVLGKPFPVLHERNLQSGFGFGHYFHQDLLVAQRIFAEAPVRHVDVGSRVDGFVAHVASFREVEVFDIRASGETVKNITFKQADFMRLSDSLKECADSVSSLHVIEHFGLGRYNDPIDVDGHLRGLENLNAILRPEGRLYLSTPIGPQRINFNAHRVFSLGYLLGLLESSFAIERFSYVDDAGKLHHGVDLERNAIESNCGCHFGCGIFELRKTR